MQQILAYETDLLEFDDLFDGNPAVDAKVEALKDGARAELANARQVWAAQSDAIDYMKAPSGRKQRRTPWPDRGGRNRGCGASTSGSRASPRHLMTGDGGIMVVDPAVEAEQIDRLNAMAGRAG